MNHRVNFSQFKLCTDIEKNPGPSVYVDATKTINAPYCQGNVTGFGENGGQRCVAMSPCALIYSKITKMTSVDDMTQVMIVGIQLYSCLSLLARQSMSMLTELPGMAIWLQACLHWRYAYFQTLLWNDTIFVVDWDILYKLCGSANKWSKGFFFSGKIWWQFFSCNKACSKYHTHSTTTPKYTLTKRLVLKCKHALIN